MSRQQSRPGKARPTKESKGKGNSADKQPTSLFEIVPGKFNENDWSVMLDNDDSQEFVWELIDEIVDNAEKIIFKNYLNRQTIPYTINEAKKAILHIIDWQFLPKDVEDDDKEAISSIVEDDEPAACKIDSWAQGYVPSLFLDEPKMLTDLDEDERRAAESSFHSPSKMDILAQLSKETSGGAKKNSPGESPRSQKLKLKTSFRTASDSGQEKPILKEPKLNRQSVKKENALANSQFMRRLDEESTSMESEIEDRIKKDARLNRTTKEQLDLKLIEDSISKAPLACQSILKTLLSRPMAMREIEIDSEGNITSITKLDPDKMHSSTAKTRFSLLDHTKQQQGGQDLGGKKSKSSSKNQSINASPSVLGSEKTRKDAIDEESELILEPAPGVVFRVGNATRMGPRRSIIGNKQQVILDKSETFLKPIKPLDGVDEATKLTVEKLLENSEEKLIRPLHRLRPIPPISNSSSTSVN